MKTINELEVYEIDGVKADPIGKERIFIESHWNLDDRLVLAVPTSKGKRIRFTLIAADVIRAVQNATNNC